MDRSPLFVGAVLLVAVLGTGLVVGLAPIADDGTDVESFPTETPASSDGDAATTDRPFTVTVDRIEKCGETCRDVTTTVANEQSTDASNVTVYSRIYAGNGTDGKVVWSGTESVGDLDAGESYTTTKRVDLSLREAYAVRQQDGWITVRTTVQSDSETVTFTERRKVA
jgi:hypothetical protein